MGIGLEKLYLDLKVEFFLYEMACLRFGSRNSPVIVANAYKYRYFAVVWLHLTLFLFLPSTLNESLKSTTKTSSTSLPTLRSLSPACFLIYTKRKLLLLNDATVARVCVSTPTCSCIATKMYRVNRTSHLPTCTLTFKTKPKTYCYRFV
jgi:hypothetical protein